MGAKPSAMHFHVHYVVASDKLSSLFIWAQISALCMHNSQSCLDCYMICYLLSFISLFHVLKETI